ncbi:MAG: hypothetical protein ACTSR2_13620 [Candidatus Hodarchaeales archaeon]
MKLDKLLLSRIFQYIFILESIILLLDFIPLSLINLNQQIVDNALRNSTMMVLFIVPTLSLTYYFKRNSIVFKMMIAFLFVAALGG